MNNLQIVQSKMFGETPLDIYQNESGAFYMTREQIGTALGYATPLDAIKNIHNRNADRLDPLSTKLSLSLVENNREVTRNIIVYNLRGVMEICRLSRQPKADAFMDFTWDIMENLHSGNAVLATPDAQVTLAPQAMQAKIDSLLELTRKILKDNIEIRNTLNYINKNELPPSSCAPPLSAKPFAETTKQQPWQDEIRRKAKEISHAASNLYPNVRCVLGTVFQKMKQDYGFVAEQTRHEYRQRHPGIVGHVKTLDAIHEDKAWREIFDALFLDFYYDVIPDQAHPQPPAANEPPVAAKQLDRVQQIAEPLAQKLGDASHNHCATYHRIYKTMDCDWSRIRKLWRTKNGAAALPSKKSLLLQNDALFRKFKKAADRIENTQSRKEDLNA